MSPQPAASSAEGCLTQLRFWGVRGSVPSPGPATVRYGGNTSCLEVRGDGEIVILDAGTGLRLLGRALMSEFAERCLKLTLLLTHTHWDHIQGLPFFLPLLRPENELRILGYEGARLGLDNLLISQMESPFFPIGMRELDGNIRVEELKELEFRVGRIRVTATHANHPGKCMGYRLFTSAGSIAFFPDNEPPLGRKRWELADDEGLAQAEREHQKMVAFLQGTEVLVMDAQYDRQEYEQRAGWGHGCVEDVVSLAIEAGVSQLVLFHHDPDHDDETIDRMTAEARQFAVGLGGILQIEAAQEGTTITLPK